MTIQDSVIEMLGRKAAECELKAAAYDKHSWEKRVLLNRAAMYRQQQAEVMTGEVQNA